MTEANYERLLPRHKELVKKYNKNVAFFQKGSFKNVLSILLSLAWCLFWLEAALRYYALLYVDFSFKNPRVYILPIILILLAFYLFKPQRVLYDRTLCGTIQKITYKAGYTVKTGAKGVPAAAKRQYRRTSVVTAHLGKAKITIKSPDGKTAKKTVLVHENFAEIYEKGAAVSSICGVKYPIPLENGVVPEGKVFCTSCSSFEPQGYGRCTMCHETLWNR